MLPEDRSIQKLEKPESLDVFIVGRNYLKSGGFIWDYKLWSNDEESNAWDKPFSALYSPEDLGLYPGHRATVVGDGIWKSIPSENRTNLVLQDARHLNFELYLGQTIYLLNLRNSDKENSTYATQLRTDVNGRPVSINMSVVMEGATIDEIVGEPSAIIIDILKPNGRKTYHLNVDYINPNKG